MEATDERSITSFLLGELSENERQSIEARFFGDDNFYDHVIAVQEDLADDYVQNKLSPQERKHFEEHFLPVATSQKTSRICCSIIRGTSSARNRIESATVPPHLPWWGSLRAFLSVRSALATSLASLLVLLLVGSWLYVQNRRLVNRVAEADWQRDQSIRQPVADEDAANQQRIKLQQEAAALRDQSSELKGTIQQKDQELEALRRENERPQLKNLTVSLLRSCSYRVLQGNQMNQKN